MNLVLFRNEEVGAEGHIQLTGVRADELIQQHELAAGLKLKAGALGYGRGSLEVLEAGPGVLNAQLLHVTPSLPRQPVVWIVAVPRPQAVKRILFNAAMLGIEAVHFIRSERTDKNYLKSQALKADSIQEELFLGAAQAGDSEIPEVYVHDRFLGFIEDVLPSVVGKHSQTGLYLADTVAGITSIDAEKKYGKVKRFLFAVGPELGWNEFEREQWGKAGAQPISLGERILRVDAACVALFWRVAILQSG